MESSETRFEDILAEIDIGPRWQLRMLFVTSLPLFFSGFHNLGGAMILFSSPDHWCNLFDGTNTTDYDRATRNNWTTARIKDFAIPRTSKGTFDQCDNYVRNYSLAFDTPWSPDWTNATTSNMTVEECHNSWTYNVSQMHSTVVSEWNLVCDNTNYASTAISAYQIGTFLGALTFGYMSDRFGRRKIALFAIAQVIVSVVGAGLAPNYTIFVLFRVMTGMALVASCHCAFILLGETIKPTSRGPYQMISNIFFALGIATAALVAYLCRDWRTFNLIGAGGTCVMLSFVWILPESPRWLILNGKLRKAEGFIRQIADISGRTDITDDELGEMVQACHRTMVRDKAEEEPSTCQSFPIVNLFLCPEMRKLVLVHGFLWAFLSCSYYGISFASPKFGSNLFLVVFLTSLTEMPAAIFGPVLVKYTSRRLSMSLTLAVAGLCCLAYLVIPSDLVWLQTTVVMFGRLIVALVYCIIYVAAAESFPTNHRQIGLGFCSTCSRFGSISSGYIVNSMGPNSVWYAMIVFGVQLISTGILALFLNETANKALPEHEHDVEHYDQLARSKNYGATGNNNELTT